MNDAELKLACLQAAVATTGDPNKLALAGQYFAFVTEGRETEPAPKTTDEAPTPTAGRAKTKGTAK